MIQNRAAIRYAKAILDFALEQKAEEAVQKDFEQVLATLEQSQDLSKLLESPVIEATEKKEVLGKIFSNQVISEKPKNKFIGPGSFRVPKAYR
jgi:F-type H+-transporting ATPase subunit delta